MKIRFGIALCLACLLQSQMVPATSAQDTQPGSKAEASLNQAMKDGKYTFLLFYKQSDDATKSMAATIKQGLTDKADTAVAAYVQITEASEQALVTKYDVSRAPMPMTIVVAPNGATTGIFAQRLTPEKLNEAFVTPTMMTVMKNLQDGKLVLVTVQGSARTPAPIAIRGFQNDPHFKDRIVSLGMTAADPLETRFVGQMQIDPQTKATQTVLLAPPGVLVGKFDALASKDDIAAALAKAGKCCDDPNCKHHQPAPRTATTPRGRR